MAMRVQGALPQDLDRIVTFPDDTGIIAMTQEEIRAEFNAGRMRPEWTWLATDPAGQLIGRAIWWGRDETAPIALDVLDVVGPSQDRIDVAAALLRAGHEALGGQGGQVLLPHTLRLRGGWRSKPDSVEAVRWRRQAAHEAGLTQSNERLQFVWTPEVGVFGAPTSLEFRPGSNAEFLELFIQVGTGSLDVTTQRSVAASSPEEMAQDQLGFYLSCPGDREWWRIGLDEAGGTAGFVIPSATPYTRNVGYLGVLPQYRGKGLVDELLAYVTTLHHAAGASHITATTDAENNPMAEAFRRHGYRNVEIRLDLEAPV